MAKKFAKLNMVQFIGRLTRDCEVRYLESGTQITNFSIAVDGSANKGEESAFLNFSKVGEFPVSQYLLQGTEVLVIGRLEQSRTEKDGVKQTYYNFQADRITLLGSPKTDDATSSYRPNDFAPPAAKPQAQAQRPQARPSGQAPQQGRPAPKPNTEAPLFVEELDENVPF